jgi:hypothetical protein
VFPDGAARSRRARTRLADAREWNQCLLFGGNDGVAPHRNDTWSRDGTIRLQRSPLMVSAIRRQHLMVSCPAPRPGVGGSQPGAAGVMLCA